MNKKLLLVGAGFTLGSALLVTSAFAGIGDAPGYDAYKTAIKTTMAAQSLSEKVALTVQDNGKTVLNVNSSTKTDKANRTASADITVQDGTHVSVYRQDGQEIVKTSASEVYTVYGGGKNEKKSAHREQGDKADGIMSTEAENVVDALVGNLKNYVTLNEQSDGTKSIGFQLKDNQIPAAANAVGSFFIKQAVNGRHEGKADNSPLASELQQVRSSMPKLTQNIQVSEADLQAVVDAQNHITKQTVEVTVSGLDAQGVSHQVVVNADIDLSGYNSTTPDKVDLTGKQVQTVQKNRFGHED